MRRLLILALFGLVLILPALAQSAETLRDVRTLFAEGDYGAVVARLETARAEAPLSPEGLRLLGLAYQTRMQHGRAIETLRLADTTDVRVHAALARSLEKLGRKREALEAYRTAYRMDSTRQSLAAALARLYAEAGRWPTARTLYERLVAHDPENGFLHARLAAAYRALDSTELAIIHYERARRLIPKSVTVYLNLSAVYVNSEHLISAWRVVDAGVAELPEEPELWRRRGEVALKREEYPEAQTSFEQALALGDSSALTLRNLGATHYLRNHLPEADSLLTWAFATDSTDAMTAFYLGTVKQYEQEYEAALDYLHRAAELMGQEALADVHAQIAATYDQMDRDGDAIRAYRLTQSLAPDRPEVLFHLAALYDAYYADPSTALEQYETFLARAEEGKLPEMEAYARQRVREIRERLFFEAGRRAAPAPSLTDTSEAHKD